MDNQLFFVYGTLRVNQGNWQSLLKDQRGARYLGQAITKRKYSLFSAGIPFVYHQPEVSNITGDLFEITPTNIIKNLDRLEGHQENVKNGYHREIVSVFFRNQEYYAWLYFYYASKPHGELISSGDWFDSQDYRRGF